MDQPLLKHIIYQPCLSLIPGKHSEKLEILQGEKLLAIYYNRYGSMPCIPAESYPVGHTL